MDDPDMDYEPQEPYYAECRYCGIVFEGHGDDCGACGLDDDEVENYIREHVR